MENKLDSYHLPVTGWNILRCAFPTIVMTVFNTFYTMVDGLFVSNLIGMEALSAINLTAPAIALITAVSGMLATGGSAVVMKKMGGHKETEARQDFTLLILTNALVGSVMMLLGYTLMDTLLGTMGLSPTVFGYCHTYLSNYLLFTIPILLHFEKPVFRRGMLFHASTNGMSELATSLVSGITILLFNLAMLKYIGEDGVAAITIIMYVLMFVSVLCTVVSILATVPLVSIFTRPDSPVYDLAVTGNRLCSIALLFVGLNVFASGMFTALSNGVVSAVLAFSRSFLFPVANIQIMPVLLGGVTGVWLATPVAELLGTAMAAALLLRYRKRYRY